MKATITVTREFNGEIVKAEICNTKKHFAWRLGVAGYFTSWTSHYEGICHIRSQKTNNVYIYLTAYWSNSLEVEQPLLLSQGNKTKPIFQLKK